MSPRQLYSTMCITSKPARMSNTNILVAVNDTRQTIDRLLQQSKQ